MNGYGSRNDREQVVRPQVPLSSKRHSYLRQVLFSPVSVCLSVCQDYSKTTDQIFMKYYEMVGHNPGTIRLNSE